MTGALLPSGFEDLEPFAELWAVEGAADRAVLRGASNPAAREAFYEAAKGRLVDALDYLDRKGLEAFDEKDRRLLNLMLSLGHVALAVEVQGPDEARHAQLARHMRITREGF